jgi:two-component system, OmpR family, heavy metal sensor histidine kinase CusS
MRSIRLSLTVYLLALLVVALGAASVLFYRTTQSSLEARKQATEGQLRSKQAATADKLQVKFRATSEMLQAKFEQDCEHEKARLKESLLSQARTLARLVQFQFDWNRFRGKEYNFLGSLGAAATPGGHVLLPLWIAEGSPTPRPPLDAPRPEGAPRKPRSFTDELYHRVFMQMRMEIRLTNNALLEHIDEEVAEYFQINTSWGAVYRSQKMGEQSFAFDKSVFKSAKVPDWDGGETGLGVGRKVYWVWFLTPPASFVPFGGGPRFWGPRGRPPESTGRSEPWAQPAIFIQVACDIRKLDAAVAALKERLDQETAPLKPKLEKDLAALDAELAADLDNVEAETTSALKSLRNHLLLLCVFIFAAVVVGTCVLIALGLKPLHRLGEAVSRVSEKDFRLQLGGRRLPRELSPIVERLTHTLEQLKRAFAREKQATADISHELRTPLAALMTTIDVALRKQRSAVEYREALEDCKASGQQINEAVERLLALARLDAGVDRLRQQPVDAVNLARQCVSVVKPLAEAHGLRLNVQGDDSAPLQTDPDKLREILNNLLHNAIQYNREGGSVDVNVHRENGHLQLQVRDTGIGIPETARPHIFERFYRADPSRQADGLHAGLGLAIVKGYLDLMGGSIDVESVEGKGSTFNIRLPA